jgi:hypothetical protein
VAFEPVDFVSAIGGTGAEAEGQPHPLPRRTRAEPPLAWAGHTSKAWERHQVYLQRRSPHTRRASYRNDLGSAPKASFQHRHAPGHPLLALRANSPCRGLQSLWRICQGHRLYRGPGRHRPDPDSPAPERTGNADPAIAGAADQSAAWDKVNRREASREGALGYIAAFRREGLRPIASKEAIENRMA